MNRFSRILLIRLSSLGDVVLVSAVLEAIKNRFPEKEVWLLTKARYAELYRGDPRLTGLLTLADDEVFVKFLDLVWRLREFGFDLVIDLHANIRSRIVCAFLVGSVKQRYSKKRFPRMEMVHLKWLKVKPLSVVDLYLEPLRRLGIEVQNQLPKLYTNEDSEKSVDNFLRSNGVQQGDRIVGINPGARWETKRWTFTGLVKLCDYLMQKPETKVVIFGDSEDREFVNMIISLVQKLPTVATGVFKLGELVAAISRCKVLVTTDSGPMHIATACGVPVVSIFGPTHPSLGFAPLGPRDVVLSTYEPCSPCSLHGERRCRYAVQYCMERIMPETVITKIEEILYPAVVIQNR